MSEQVRKSIETFKEEIVFNLLEDGELALCTECFDLVKYQAGEIIFKEGDPGDFILIVVSGKLEVKKKTEFSDKQIILAHMTRGAIVGELSLFDGNERSATVAAREDTTVILLNRERLDEFMAEHPHTGIKILKGMIHILSIRLRKATERLTAIF